MGEVEDLSAKAARLWLEFLEAQARAATSLAQRLPEVARSLTGSAATDPAAVADPPIERAAERPEQAERPETKPMGSGTQVGQPVPAVAAVAADRAKPAPALLVRGNHRKLKAATHKSLARRRLRRS